MTYCVWNHDAHISGVYVCKNCNQRAVKIPLSQRANYPKRICKNEESTCLHRNEQLRLQLCDSCSGKIQIKVFACAVHSECTIANKLENLACCAICKDFSPKKEFPQIVESGVDGSDDT